MNTVNLILSKKTGWVKLQGVEEGCELQRVSGPPVFYIYSTTTPPYELETGHPIRDDENGFTHLIGGDIWVKCLGTAKVTYTPMFIGTKSPAAAIGDLDDLHTSTKVSTVLAINEVLGIVQAMDLDAVITDIGNLVDLTTSNKTSIVASINSVQLMLSGVSSTLSGLINDLAGSSVTDKTWSAAKIIDYVQGIKSDIMGGIAPSTLDTILELATELQSAGSALSSVSSALSKRVAVDQVQNFTGPEKIQGCANLGAATADSVGDTDIDLVAVFNAALI